MITSECTFTCDMNGWSSFKFELIKNIEMTQRRVRAFAINVCWCKSIFILELLLTFTLFEKKPVTSNVGVRNPCLYERRFTYYTCFAVIYKLFYTRGLRMLILKLVVSSTCVGKKYTNTQKNSLHSIDLTRTLSNAISAFKRVFGSKNYSV